MKKNILIALGLVLLLVLTCLQVLIISKSYGEGTEKLSGMATSINKIVNEEVQNPAKVTEKIVAENKVKDMNPGNTCGNGLCEINEFNYNCPQDC